MTKWNLKKIDWSKYKKKKNDLQNPSLHDIDLTKLNGAIETFESNINTAAQEASPPRKPKNNNDNKKKHSTPWWNEECQAAQKESH